ncbi:MAG: hypothetical protein ACWA5U_11440 [bacterium]
MGRAKQVLEKSETQRQYALQIALEAGVLTSCEFHEDAILGGQAEIERAYKLGNSKFSSGELSGVFSSRTEMTDLIKDVVSTNFADGCYSCAKWRDS